jgi:Rrf2 family protein
MLKIRRETDYALRCVCFLARHRTRVIMQSEIAEEMRVPKAFVAKILRRLVKAGLIASFMGVNGGFQLVRSPATVSLFDVVSAMEGPVAFNVCAIDKENCRFSGTCPIHPFWLEIKNSVETQLKNFHFDRVRSKPLPTGVMRRD